MTTTTLLPPTRPFSPEDCEAMVSAGIIAEGHQADVLAGARRFTVDEYLAMGEAGILHEDERIELLDGEIIIMPPIGDYHEAGTDWLTLLFVQALGERAMVRIQGSIRLNNHSAPQPDVAILRRRPRTEVGPYFPPDIYLVIEVADSSLRYDLGVKSARYAAAGILEVWIANLRQREVVVFTDLSGSEYANVRTFRAGESISPRAFTDLSFAVDDFMPPATGPHGEMA